MLRAVDFVRARELDAIGRLRRHGVVGEEEKLNGFNRRTGVDENNRANVDARETNFIANRRVQSLIRRKRVAKSQHSGTVRRDRTDRGVRTSERNVENQRQLRVGHDGNLWSVPNRRRIRRFNLTRRVKSHGKDGKSFNRGHREQRRRFPKKSVIGNRQRHHLRREPSANDGCAAKPLVWPSW